MNATHFYLETCRYVVEADLDDPSSWIEIQKHLTGIRLTLTCCVCGRLLNRPMGPARSVCHHYVCKDCIGGKMRYIKRGCGWCKSFEEFVDNKQLECVVRCFRQLCQYLRAKGVRILSSPTVDATVRSLLSTIQEATTDRNSENSAVLLPVGEPKVAALRDAITHRKSASRKRMKSRIIQDDQDSDKEVCFKHKQPKFESFDPVNTSSDSLSNGNSFCTAFVTEQRFAVNCSPGETSRSADRHFSGNGRRASATVDTYHDSQSEMNALDSGCDSEKKLENFVLAEHDYNKCTAEEMDTSAGHSNWTSEEEQQSPKRTAHTREPADGAVPTSRKSKLASARGHAAEQTLSTSPGANAAAVGNCTGGSSSNRNDTSDSSGRRCKTKGKAGCRCALATPNPGKLTCCGQRCPCYAAFKGCDNCKCRGCRNPRGDPRNIPASLVRALPASQTLASMPHGSMNKISATVT